MAINTKEIKKRIGSIKNTKKITKAMEMIAAVKMRKAVEAAVKTREYAALANELMNGLGSKELNHPLTRTVPIEETQNYIESKDPRHEKLGKHLLVIITSNRGLCGSYNSKILKQTHSFIQKHQDKPFEIIGIGNKSGLFAKRQNIPLVQMYTKLGDTPDYQEVLSLAESLRSQFIAGVYDKVTVFFTNYISGLSQKPAHRTILPVTPESVTDMINDTGDARTGKDFDPAQFAYVSEKEYEFEPGRNEVLDFVLPMLVEVVLYQALLESAASEHSSRMIAMKNASDSAGDMIDDLTLQYNKGRQAAITQEISEIVSGAAALE